MYHGTSVPGFPKHPHRGFETITVAQQGFVDHSDSLGATARFGAGDAQWMTAGRGIVHAEMFPLIHQDRSNPTELFQVWLNLPSTEKMVEPYFTMLWRESLPNHRFQDDEGRAGTLGGAPVPHPPPNSWAARPENEVAIWTLNLEAESRWRLPAVSPGIVRSLYFHRGGSLRVGGQFVSSGHRIVLPEVESVELEATDETAHLLLLQGRPMNEPVAHYGPFVMNTTLELQEAFRDYQRTGFGVWPWSSDDPAHPRERGRFAQHPDGRVERP